MGYVDEEGGATTLDETCGDTSISGCYIQERPGETGPGLEHAAGPGCASGRGYSGYRITMEEMVGCRAVQCLVKKEKGWREQKKNENWKMKGGYLLTGVEDGSPDEAPLEGIKPVRHGVDSIFIGNLVFRVSGLAARSREWFRMVSSLYCISASLTSMDSGHGELVKASTPTSLKLSPVPSPSATGMTNGGTTNPAHEYLAANIINISMLCALLSQARHSIPKTILGANILPKDDLRIEPIDRFSKLSNELTSEILDYLGSRKIVNLRLTSGAFRCVPNFFLFRRLVMEDMPWAVWGERSG
ncbi:MAG: hypothetical protein M1836_008174 [Candelina mexicana]|nr:MAG: hypothetical protein M1836_008174 [Candelina mexicana]